TPGSVSQSHLKQYIRAEGETLYFTDPVLREGFLDKDGHNIARVVDGKLIVNQPEFSDRLHWDNKTGLFYIPDMKSNHSGVYAIENKSGEKGTKTEVKLTVYSPVSQPRVQASYSASPSTTSCSLLCSVENGRGVTLSWLTEGRSLISTKNSALSTNLTLQLEAAGLSEPLVCSATNPVDSSTTSVRLEDYCPVLSFIH
uniref:Ig-like domain-containing protein n=1 Tax=Lepisosteus oculatus TaxID=7918 RepID=W5LXK2_LEPOC